MWHPAFLFFFQALGVYNIMIRLRPRCRAYPFISIPSHSVSSRFIQAALLLKLCLHHSFDILLGKIWDWSTLDIPLHPTPFLVFAASPLCACALHLPKKKVCKLSTISSYYNIAHPWSCHWLSKRSIEWSRSWESAPYNAWLCVKIQEGGTNNLLV